MKIAHALSILLLSLCLTTRAADDDVIATDIGPKTCEDNEENEFFNPALLICQECKHTETSGGDEYEFGLLVPTSDRKKSFTNPLSLNIPLFPPTNLLSYSRPWLCMCTWMASEGSIDCPTRYRCKAHWHLWTAKRWNCGQNLGRIDRGRRHGRRLQIKDLLWGLAMYPRPIASHIMFESNIHSGLGQARWPESDTEEFERS